MSGREEIQNFKTYLLAKEKLNQVDYQEVVSNLRSTNFIKYEADKIYQPLLFILSYIWGPVRKMRIYNVKHCFLLYLLNSSYFYTIQN